MSEFAITALLFACLVAVGDWKRGMFLTVAVALLQDPLRKVIPGQPPYFILFAGLVYGAAILGAMRAHVPLRPSMVVGWSQNVGAAFHFFVLVVLLQAVHSFVRFGIPLVTILGLISYLAPFVALTLAHAYSATTGSEGTRRFLQFYAIGASLALCTIYLEAAGLGWPILGEVGEGIRIYDQGGLLVAHSGTYRASEIAAWHAAMCACVAILLLTYATPSVGKIALALVLVAAIVFLGIQTGRRKFLVVIAVFCCAYVGLIGLLSRRMRVASIPAAFLGGITYFVFLLAADPDGPSALQAAAPEYQLYVQRANSTFGDVNSRFLELGLAPIGWAYDWFGFWGGGAGIGTQGVQHLTDMGEHVGAAEGGLGKIMLELGAPGLLAIVALGISFLRHIWRLFNYLITRSEMHARLAFGLASILIANVASFSVATQAFGDVFVLVFLGIIFGMLLAAPRVIDRDLVLQEEAMRQKVAASGPRGRAPKV